jgi:cyclopropane-fatty-acyl-phospholipid synthase
MSSLITGVVEGALDLVRRYGAGSTAWGPLLRLSRTGVLALLQQIAIGQLLIIEKDGAQTLCGQSTVAGLPAEPKTELRIHEDAFWVRLALFADMVSVAIPHVKDKD